MAVVLAASLIGMFAPAVPAATPGTHDDVIAYGDAGFFGSTGQAALTSPLTSISRTPSGQGYWLVATDGGIFNYGDAAFYGSTGAIRLNRPIVGMASTPSGRGYWLVASDGGIFSYGDAAFFGSTGSIHLNKPIVGMAPTPSGGGYWLVASDGGIFSYGNASFFGSTGSIHLNQPIVGMAATATGGGYWMVASDGGIFSYGDASFFGSTGSIHLNQPVIGMNPTPSGQGYWMVAADGGIFRFGDAGFYGSLGNQQAGQRVVGMAATPSGGGYWLATRGGSSSTSPGPSPGPSPSPGTPPPPGTMGVHVSGNHLVAASGAVLQLHGVNRSGAEYGCVQGFGPFDGPSDAPSVAAIASWKGVNAVRVPLNEDCWLGINGYPNAGYSAAQYQQLIRDYVNLLHSDGMYVILDLHWTAAGTNGATHQQPMTDTDHSPAFWSSVGAYFKSDPATVFDLFNEPYGISWPCWRDGCSYSGFQVAGMQQLVNAVRSSGATNVVMAGGLAYANDLSQWVAYEPSDPQHQLAASFHIYNFNPCTSTTCWNSQLAPVVAQVPLVAGEIGEDDSGAAFISGFMSWAEPQGVSYLAWTWDTWGCGGAVLISNYDGTPCPGFGTGYRSHLAALP